MTIKAYLQGITDYPISEEAILTILDDRKVEEILPTEHLEKSTKELLKADVYSFCANNMPSIKGGVEDSHGGWKHRDGGWQCSEADRRTLRKMANRIYSEYGEAEKVVSSSVKIQKL